MLSIKDITIDAELELLLPPLSEDENVELLKSIQRDGFTDPIIVWLGHNILVDGHNRHRIWTTTGMSEDDAPEIIEKQFTSRDAVKEWMLRRQLARRNLTDAMRVMVALQLRPMLESKAKEKQKAGGVEKVPQQKVEPIEVRDEIAKSAGVSKETVRKVEAVLEKADDTTKADMLAGKTSIAEAHRKATEQPAPVKTWEVFDDISRIRQVIAKLHDNWVTESDRKIIAQFFRQCANEV